ncbi:hypothetical protein J7E81_11500 [Bacillus sp. ISL-18]|uniref:hypothetical protein n=1 Tax=Bacillus sp. ISL-18 TaxID=2819118 RepID=UPI001BE5B3E4|nr:hypothetical protein [Bacillus sp. ISL-18]MBT2655852.1 hypothetical protein [Bacillus sp. ISL-18]
MTIYKKVESILGVDVRARHKNLDNKNYDPFKNPLIHKQIKGNEHVPLHISKLWGD